MSQYIPEAFPQALRSPATGTQDVVRNGAPVTGELWGALEQACQHMAAYRREIIPAALYCMDITTTSKEVNVYVQKAAYPRHAFIRAVVSSAAASSPTVTITIASTSDSVSQTYTQPLTQQVVDFDALEIDATGASVTPTAEKITITASVDAGSATLESISIVLESRTGAIDP